MPNQSAFVSGCETWTLTIQESLDSISVATASKPVSIDTAQFDRALLTLYSPKSRNLEFLQNKSEDLARDLIEVSPRDGKFVREVELEWLSQRV